MQPSRIRPIEYPSLGKIQENMCGSVAEWTELNWRFILGECQIVGCPAYLFCQYDNSSCPCFRCDMCDNFWFEGMDCMSLPEGCRYRYL